jgi:hypothetical protein
MSNGRSHDQWASFFDQHYRSGDGRSQAVLIPTVGMQASQPGAPNPPAPPPTRASVAPLALWLTSRWSDIHTRGPLYGRLSSLNWAPDLNSRFLQVSYEALTPSTVQRGVIAGENFFAQCVTAYVRSLGQLGLTLMRYLFHGGYGGGIGERTVLDPVSSAERMAFENQVATWGMTNGSPGRSPGPGLPANGLPYGLPQNPRPGIGTHKDRIAAIYRIVRDVADGHPFEFDRTSQTAGIVEPSSGGPPPYLFRWF